MLRCVKAQAIGVFCALLAAICLTGPSLAAQETQSSVKVIVDASRPQVIDEVRAAGGRLLADRGSYLVFEVAGDRAIPGEDQGVVVRADFDTVHLRRGRLRTRLDRATGPRVLPKSRAGRRLKLVQLASPPLDSDLDALVGKGARIVQYVPENAYIVWTPDEPAAHDLEARAAGLPLIQYVEDYAAEHALSPRLDTEVGTTRATEVVIQLFNQEPQATADIDAIKRIAIRISAAPHAVVRGRYLNLRAVVSGRELESIAALPTVVNVEPHTPPQLHGEREGQILAGNLDAIKKSPTGPGYLAWLAAKGFSTAAADYPIVAIVDDGVDNGTTTPVNSEFYVDDNPTQPSRIAFAVTPPGSSTNGPQGPDGHGNLNASILAGYSTDVGLFAEDIFGFNYGLGIAPHGRMANVRIFNPLWDIGTSTSAMVSDYFGRGARISSNSWGTAAQGIYDTEAQEYDALTRDAQVGVAGNQELLFVFSAGNDGPSYASLGSPATAKNVIAVGASESFNFDASQGTGCGDTVADGDDARDVADFSSRGPCVDGRVKPDVLAPGTFVQGAASRPVFNGSGVCGAASNDFNPPGIDALYPPGTSYTWSSGTSHSTPAIAGYASLAAEYLARTFGATDPSPALLKAYILHSGRHITGAGANDALPSPNQGFGLADMAIGFEENTFRFIHDQEIVLASSGSTATFTGAIPQGDKPMRVALVWSDAPGPTFADAYVNDLNLVVTAGTTIYRGNNFSLGVSQPGGAPDIRNNVELLVLPPGITGPVTITVEGFGIGDDGVPGNSDPTDQDFALVASNFTNATSAGSVTLDAGLYSCADTVSLTLRDIDLLGSASAVVQAITAGGDVETLTLQETPPASGTFVGALQTSAASVVPQSGILESSDGDVITVRYNDADDGTTGPAIVEDSAGTDCVPPDTTSVASTTIGGTFATITVDTDEPATVILRYGTACNAVAGALQSNLAATTHALTVTGLTPLTPHFFTVEIVDLAGNIFVDDNNGNCYAFATLEPPDYFTELFTANDFDLANRTVRLTPDGSGNAYHACAVPASAFPTDPSGGMVLDLTDDASQRIDIGGGAQVPFYDVPHSTLYVNSNGNVTFGAADSDFSETIIDHFRLPRVAALFDDLDPGVGGTISWKQLADRAVVTFENIPRFELTDSNSFQIELFFDGTIQITYLAIAANQALAGISRGLGVPIDFVESDLGGYDACSPSAGRLSIDKPIYTCTDTLTATVEDADLVAAGAVDIDIEAGGGDSEALTLTESPAGSGKFTGAIGTSSEPFEDDDGTLQIGSTQTITATYEDIDDGSGNPATRVITARTLCTDHFMFYKARVARDGPSFYKFGPITLADEFRTATYDVIKPILLGLPANKNDEGVNDSVTHLEEFKIKAADGTPRFAKVSDIRVISQCGDLYVQAMGPASVLVPAHVDLAAPTTPPAANEHHLDHFLCYRAKALKKLDDGTPVSAVAKGTQADVSDGFQTRRYDLKRVTKLCTPADKSGSPIYISGPSKGTSKSISPAIIRNADDRLVCYKATLAKKLIAQDGCGPLDPEDTGIGIEPPQDEHEQLVNVHVSDQFGSRQRNTIREMEVCIPSLRLP